MATKKKASAKKKTTAKKKAAAKKPAASKTRSSEAETGLVYSDVRRQLRSQLLGRLR